MNMLINNLNIFNISIQFSQYYNYYKIFYICDYIKLIGITINIKISKYKKKNNLYYIYIEDKESYDKLYNIECTLRKTVDCYLFRNEYNQRYIICNCINNLKDKKDINININKLKYMYNNYVPIINII